MSDPVRVRILDEATRLFGEQGYGGTSVRDLAKAAGVTNPTIYYHFGSKEGLYLEALRFHAEAGMALAREALTSEGTVRQRITAAMHSQLGAIRANRSAAQLLMYANHRPGADEPQLDMISLHEDSHRLTLEVIAEGIASGELRADLDPLDVFVQLNGMFIFAGWAVMTEQPVADDLVERMVDLLYRGVAA